MCSEGSTSEVYTCHGKLTCTSGKCQGQKWTSMKVAITIRQLESPVYSYNATVFNQKCKSCQSLGELELNEDSYIERVIHRLRVWAGIPIERPNYGKKIGPDHKRSLYKGYRLGRYQEGQKNLNHPRGHGTKPR
ncbi:zinc-binding domain-containing protein [Podospora fimiseda]|uniref:Zinc-binding domain-containing protein n=1 Tax=Podospora fimiseda TaxID=252190 RepID=A0AAN6YN69_9PEZI|nr:zinc-binding domain-containing protein [Podospora fimiseda]